MGRLLRVFPCPVCNYHVEDELHEGGSGIDVQFLRNHYALATCNTCHNLVSVMVPNTDEEISAALKKARDDIMRMEGDAVIGDPRARELLPLFRMAVDEYGDEIRPVITACTMCGSKDVEIVSGVDGADYDAHDAWVHCPRCAEGQLLVETCGSWD